MLATIMGAVGLSPASLIAISGAVLAALAWLWNTKRVSFNKGVAEERAKTDAANADFVKEHKDEEVKVGGLSDDAVDRELQRWAPKP